MLYKNMINKSIKNIKDNSIKVLIIIIICLIIAFVCYQYFFYYKTENFENELRNSSIIEKEVPNIKTGIVNNTSDETFVNNIGKSVIFSADRKLNELIKRAKRTLQLESVETQPYSSERWLINNSKSITDNKSCPPLAVSIPSNNSETPLVGVSSEPPIWTSCIPYIWAPTGHTTLSHPFNEEGKMPICPTNYVELGGTKSEAVSSLWGVKIIRFRKQLALPGGNTFNACFENKEDIVTILRNIDAEPAGDRNGLELKVINKDGSVVTKKAGEYNFC